MNGVWVVILAGGQGTRFWPASTASRPKQCLEVDGRSLLQHTLDRLDGIPRERVLVVTGVEMEAEVRAQLDGVPTDNVLVEPSGRNTAPAVAWAAQEIERRSGEVMVVLPSDHRIDDVAAFRKALKDAVAVARSSQALVLLGQPPTFASTGFGWIIVGDGIEGHEGAFEVDGFIEKPDEDTAQWLLDAGAMWNGGMFVWTVAAIRNAFERTQPATWKALHDGNWAATTAISIDTGVIESAPHLAVLQCDFGWGDLGTWTAMAELMPVHALGKARVKQGVALEGGGHIVHAPDSVVATLGVSDLLIVEANGVLLVARKEDAKRVGELLKALEE